MEIEERVFRQDGKHVLRLRRDRVQDTFEIVDENGDVVLVWAQPSPCIVTQTEFSEDRAAMELTVVGQNEPVSFIYMPHQIVEAVMRETAMLLADAKADVKPGRFVSTFNF
jgi:hypothetical protein